MEFGALQCTPKSPECTNCPLNSSCFAFSNTKVDVLPRKNKKVKQRNRYFNYLMIKNKDATYLEQRTGKGIWENLYQFPLIETSQKLLIENLIQTPEWEELFKKTPYHIHLVHSEVKHILSHQIIHTRFIEIEVNHSFETSYQKVTLRELDQYPVPVLISNFIERYVPSVLV